MRLLVRTTRKLTLTEAGRRLSGEHRASPRRSGGGGGDGRGGAGRGSRHPAGQRAAVVRRAGDRAADARVRPVSTQRSSSTSASPTDLSISLRKGWDLAIRIGRMQDSSMIARRLAPCRMVVCGITRLSCQAWPASTLKDLADHNCLSYTLRASQSGGRWLFGPEGASACRSPAISAPTMAMLCWPPHWPVTGSSTSPRFWFRTPSRMEGWSSSNSTNPSSSFLGSTPSSGEPPAAREGTGIRRVPWAALWRHSALGSLLIYTLNIVPNSTCGIRSLI